MSSIAPIDSKQTIILGSTPDKNTKVINFNDISEKIRSIGNPTHESNEMKCSDSLLKLHKKVSSSFDQQISLDIFFKALGKVFSEFRFNYNAFIPTPDPDTPSTSDAPSNTIKSENFVTLTLNPDIKDGVIGLVCDGQYMTATPQFKTNNFEFKLGDFKSLKDNENPEDKFSAVFIFRKKSELEQTKKLLGGDTLKDKSDSSTKNQSNVFKIFMFVTTVAVIGFATHYFGYLGDINFWKTSN